LPTTLKVGCFPRLACVSNSSSVKYPEMFDRQQKSQELLQ